MPECRRVGFTILLWTVLGLVVSPSAGARETRELTWEDLIPPRSADDDGEVSKLFFGVAPHGSVSLAPDEGQTLQQLVHTLDGELVRMPGYVVPLEFDGAKVTDFFLVPYIGACIHVPPPPPNQLVYVRIEDGFEIEGLFQAVYVTGTMNSASSQQSLEQSGYGYRIEADDISAFQ